MSVEDKLVPATTVETGLDIAAVVGSVIPVLGGPVGAVLSGMSTGRKLARVRDVLKDVANDLQALTAKIREEYVATEDFEELLEATLRRIAEERHEEKRNVYRHFLVGAITTPGHSHDEQLRLLRALEQVEPAHLQLLKALGHPPDPPPGFLSGSPEATLKRRLSDLDAPRIGELVAELNDLRLTNLRSLRVMMTAQGAEDLRGSITPFGQRFLRYLQDSRRPLSTPLSND